jgi:hypothetical protein
MPSIFRIIVLLLIIFWMPFENIISVLSSLFKGQPVHICDWIDNLFNARQMDIRTMKPYIPDEFYIPPQGKYRIIGYDKWDGGRWMQGEYDLLGSAIKDARSNKDENSIFYIYSFSGLETVI